MIREVKDLAGLHNKSPWSMRKLARMVALEVADLWDCPDITWWFLATGDERLWAQAADGCRVKADGSSSFYAAMAASNAAIGNRITLFTTISYAIQAIHLSEVHP